MKRILIVNDDGIQAEGLIKLAKAAARCGLVWVVAPEGSDVRAVLSGYVSVGTIRCSVL